MSTQEQFADKVQELLTQSKNLSLDARGKILDLLNDARTKIIGQLADLDPASFNAAQLQVLKSSVDSAMKEFAAAATKALDGFEAKEFTLGAQSVSEPLATLGIE